MCGSRPMPRWRAGPRTTRPSLRTLYRILSLSPDTVRSGVSGGSGVSIGDPYGGSGGGSVLGWAVRALGIWAAIGLVVYVAVDQRGMLFDGNTAVAKIVTPGEAPPTAALTYHADQRGPFGV